MTARQTAFQEAALLAKGEAIATETALLFTLQQENHNNDKEMKAMKEALETMKGEIARLANSHRRRVVTPIMKTKTQTLRAPLIQNLSMKQHVPQQQSNSE